MWKRPTTRGPTWKVFLPQTKKHWKDEREGLFDWHSSLKVPAPSWQKRRAVRLQVVPKILILFQSFGEFFPLTSLKIINIILPNDEMIFSSTLYHKAWQKKVPSVAASVCRLSPIWMDKKRRPTKRRRKNTCLCRSVVPSFHAIWGSHSVSCLRVGSCYVVTITYIVTLLRKEEKSHNSFPPQ